ncbi:MAG: cyclopropane-fatty-acyl-phospholipid synthase family protein [Alphaproteobacteria bacterium]|nr:cyclopropane-fatty-acyl-phospholipid synthase family protein [Alphaproteobacteria bacterium]
MFGAKKDFGIDLRARPAGERGQRHKSSRPVWLFRTLAPVIGAFARHGRLRIDYRNIDEFEYGDGTGPLYRIRLNTLHLVPRIVVNPDLGCGEGYMNREWDLERGDLAGLIGMFCRNEHSASETLWGRRIRYATRLLHKARRISPRKARRNAAHHYDIGNDLYEGFLDDGMNYSCAFFESPDQSLRDAQLNKLRTTIRRLEIEAGSRVLDIGCGWGELTRLIAAESEAAQITGITLAERQRDWARHRAGAWLGARLDYRLVDYRIHAEENPGRYDRIVSIGMFEHVGAKHFAEYFGAVRRMLSDDGRALIHTIMRAKRSETSPWVQKYIFPGGYIPTLQDTVTSARQAGLDLAHEPFIHGSFHYAETLRRWRANFNDAWPHLKSDRYDERFRRMWNYYLAGSEAAFDTNGMYVGQVLLRKA